MTRVVKVFRHGSLTVDNQPLKWRVSHMFLGFFIATVISFVLLSTQSSEVAFVLIAFNFFFVSLTFPLNGLLAAKVLLLALGNLIGLLWNYLFSLFAYAISHYVQGFFNVVWSLLGPLANMMWIVTFYSVSLTFLSSLRIDQQGREFDS
jgi:hypothetical protein